MEQISTSIGPETPNSSESRICRTSQGLTRSPSLPPNAGETVGRILNRFRLAQGWNAEDPENHKLRVAAWLEVLGVNRIPVDEYDDLYRRALETRARKQVEGQEVFYLRPDDLVIEFKALARPEPPAMDPANCLESHNHRSEDEALQDYGMPGEPEHWLPCHVCRPKAFSQRRSAAYGERAERKRQDMVRRLLEKNNKSDDVGDPELDAITEARRLAPNDPELFQKYRDIVAARMEANNTGGQFDGTEND